MIHEKTENFSTSKILEESKKQDRIFSLHKAYKHFKHTQNKDCLQINKKRPKSMETWTKDINTYFTEKSKKCQ